DAGRERHAGAEHLLKIVMHGTMSDIDVIDAEGAAVPTRRCIERIGKLLRIESKGRLRQQRVSLGRLASLDVVTVVAGGHAQGKQDAGCLSHVSSVPSCTAMVRRVFSGSRLFFVPR